MPAMTDDDRLWELLDKWEQLRSAGNDPAVEDICAECPELIDRVREYIAALKATDWMCQPSAQADESTVRVKDAETGGVEGVELGEYTILEELGRGGMGQVFRAVHRRMNRQVAIKFLPTSRNESTDTKRRFQREIESIARLSHPNIVTAYDAGESNGRQFLVMELVEGTDLAQHVKQHGPMTVEESLDAVVQAAHGLAHAHNAQIVHRDVKPSNLLRDDSGTIKVTDLGLARFNRPGARSQMELSEVSQSGQVLGTVDYMAPEQAINSKEADHRADIYSLGCSLHYLLTGQAIYGGETVLEKLVAHREKPIPPLTDSRPDVTEEVDRVFRRMVAKKPEYRHQSMDLAIADLEECRQTASERRATAKSKRNVALVVALAIIGLGFVGWLGAVIIKISTRDMEVTVRVEGAVDGDVDGSKETLPRREIQDQSGSNPGNPQPPSTGGVAGQAHSLPSLREIHCLVGNQEKAFDVAFHADGRLLASAGQDGVVRLWNVQTGDLLKSIPGESDVVNCVDFDSQRGLLAWAGRTGVLVIWDMKAERVRCILEGDMSTRSIRFSPNGQMLATVNGDLGKVAIWEIAQRQCVWEDTSHLGTAKPTGDVWYAICLGFSRDGTLFASGGEEATCMIWDAKTKQCRHVLREGRAPIRSLDFSPDGTVLATGGRDGFARLWNTTTGTLEQVIPGFGGSIAFSPDGSLLVSAGGSRLVRLWDVKAEQALATEGRGHTDVIDDVAFSPDGTMVASASHDGTVRLWEVPTAEQRACHLADLDATVIEVNVFPGHKTVGDQIRHPHSVGGSMVRHSISAHPLARRQFSRVGFNLDGAYRELHGSGGMNDKVTVVPHAVTFRVMGDGNELWRAQPTRNGGMGESYRVDVRGITNLELRVESAGDPFGAHAIWIDPVLLR